MQRKRKQQFVKVFIVGLVVVSINLIFLGLVNTSSPSLTKEEQDRRFNLWKSHVLTTVSSQRPEVNSSHSCDKPSWGKHKLCIIVPFKNRFEELLLFAPHMHSYLCKKKIRHKILIMNQVDLLRFNRASLINAGFLESDRSCDYIAMHDVDLLPANPDLSYDYPDKGPFHVAAPNLHPKYHYKTFVGGILLLTKQQFKKVNGLSNKFWGWGREDDEFYIRMIEANFTIYRPKNIKTGYDTFHHEHDKVVRKRDYSRYYDQKKVSKTRDRKTGLHDVKYIIVKRSNILIDGAPVSILNTELYCDLQKTPFCVHPDNFEGYYLKISNTSYKHYFFDNFTL